MMRSRMRRPLSIAVGAALLLTGVIATPGAAASPGAGGGGAAASMTKQVDDVVVSARLSFPSGGNVRGSVAGTLTLTHNGTSATVESGRITMVDPLDRSLVGSEFVASGTADAWTSTVDLPADTEPGIYRVTLSAEVAVTTDDGVIDVPIRTSDPFSVPFRESRYIPTMWIAPAGAPAGAVISVSGLANARDLGTGDHEPATEQVVNLYFDPAGDAPEALRETLTTDSRGFFTSRQTPTVSGTWRAEMPMTDSGSRTATTLSSAQRPRDTTVRQGSVSATQNGFTAGDHLITQDVVVGMDSVQRRVDVGSLGFTIGGTSGWVSVDSQRGEGVFPDGYRTQQELVHSGVGTSHATFTFRPTLPAGVYDVGIRDAMKACSAPDWDGNTGAMDNCSHSVLVEDPTVTTIVVKRASSTTVSASPTSFTGPRTITLRGEVRRVQLVNGGVPANRLAADVPVKLYFDPAGASGPVYKKEVRTGSDGTYTTSVATSTSGQWIAEYPGTALQAPSRAVVTITVG